MQLWEYDSVFDVPGWHLDHDHRLGCFYVRFGMLVLATVGTLAAGFDLIEALTAVRNPDVEVTKLHDGYRTVVPQ